MKQKNPSKPKISILTGPPGAGKSTIAKILCKNIKNSAHVSCDDLRDLIKNRAKIGEDKWEEQLKLGAENTCLLANNFYKYGYNVIIDDIICTKEKLSFYKKHLKNFKLIMLMPNKKILIERDLRRGKNALKERALFLHKKFYKFIKKEKLLSLDTSSQTPQETAKEIINILKL